MRNFITLLVCGFCLLLPLVVNGQDEDGLSDEELDREVSRIREAMKGINRDFLDLDLVKPDPKKIDNKKIAEMLKKLGEFNNETGGLIKNLNEAYPPQNIVGGRPTGRTISPGLLNAAKRTLKEMKKLYDNNAKSIKYWKETLKLFDPTLPGNLLPKHIKLGEAEQKRLLDDYESLQDLIDLTSPPPPPVTINTQMNFYIPPPPVEREDQISFSVDINKIFALSGPISGAFDSGTEVDFLLHVPLASSNGQKISYVGGLEWTNLDNKAANLNSLGFNHGATSDTTGIGFKAGLEFEQVFNTSGLEPFSEFLSESELSFIIRASGSAGQFHTSTGQIPFNAALPTITMVNPPKGNAGYVKGELTAGVRLKRDWGSIGVHGGWAATRTDLYIGKTNTLTNGVIGISLEIEEPLQRLLGLGLFMSRRGEFINSRNLLLLQRR